MGGGIREESHSSQAMPGRLELVDDGDGWRIRFPNGSMWAQRVGYCPFCGAELGALRERDPARFPGGMPKNARAVRCLDTGEEFPSIAAAARACGCGAQGIMRTINGHQTTAGGRRWERA